MMGLRASLIFTLAALPACSADSADRITAGFGQLPPLHYGDAHGRATGFIVDSFNEAARREGIKVTWKPVAGSQGIEPALADHRIDMFPAAIVTQARLHQYWVSEPWWTEDLSILARSDLGIDRHSDWQGERVLLASRSYLNIASIVMPGATFEILAQQRPPRGLEFSVPLLCIRHADAVLMPHSTLDEVLAHRPPECSGTSFEIIETAHSLPLALISRWESKGLAERIYSQITEMGRDGTLTRLAVRYPRISARSAVMLAETLRLRYERRSLWTALVGTLLIAIMTGTLLTRQIRIQGALRRAMAKQNEMEQMLRARTHELTVSNEELQAFAYSVSHDLQEPLRIISLYAQLIQGRFPPDSAEAQSYLDTIRRHALRMTEMMQQLLQLSRVARSEVQRVYVSLHDVVKSVLRDLEIQIDETSAEILIGEMPSVPGWPDRLNVLFHNLIANALKYRKDNISPRIEIRAVDHGTEWQLSVADNGIGFEQRYAAKIFGVFRRLHTHDKYGGTGVGLAIVKRVVERHGGQIWAEGRPGEGSTFYFTLLKDPTDSPVNSPTSGLSHSLPERF